MQSVIKLICCNIYFKKVIKKDNLNLVHCLPQNLVSSLASHQALLSVYAEKISSDLKTRFQKYHVRLDKLSNSVQNDAGKRAQSLIRLADISQGFGIQLEDCVSQLAELRQRLPHGPEEGDTKETLHQKLRAYRALQDTVSSNQANVKLMVDQGRQILKGVDCPSLASSIADLEENSLTLGSNIALEVKRWVLQLVLYILQLVLYILQLVLYVFFGIGYW